MTISQSLSMHKSSGRGTTYLLTTYRRSRAGRHDSNEAHGDFLWIDWRSVYGISNSEVISGTMYEEEKAGRGRNGEEGRVG